jgi:hypothetical protein
MQRYMPTFFQMSNGPETWAGMKEDSQDGEWYSRADVDARIAELEAFIKVILPSWPDGDEYPTEVSMLEMQRREIAELEKALRWAIENGVARNYVHGGLHSLIDDVPIELPADIAGVLSSLMER